MKFSKYQKFHKKLQITQKPLIIEWLFYKVCFEKLLLQ